MKEQGKNTPDLTNEEEIGSLSEKEFRIMIVKMIQSLGARIDKMQETFNKDVEELKRNQAMMKNTIHEIKNTLEGISFRFDGEIKTFTDNQHLREFSTTKPALKQMLKELL